MGIAQEWEGLQEEAEEIELTANPDRLADAMKLTLNTLLVSCHCCNRVEARGKNDRPHHWARILASQGRNKAIQWYFCPKCIRKMYQTTTN